MAKTMLIALWLRNTFWKQGRTNENRMTRLKAAVEKVAEVRRQIHTDTPWATPEVVFIAPEYLFAEPTGERWNPADPPARWRAADPHTPEGQSRERHIDEAKKNRIKAELIELSAQHPEMLLVPGTIAWSVRAKDHPGLLPAAAMRVAHEGEDSIGAFENEKAPVTPAEKLDRLKSFGNLAGRAAGRVAGPALSAAERERLDKARLCLNTCFVLHGGKVVHVYGKEGDFYEVLAPARAGIAYQVAVPGDKPGVFQVGAHWYGIEICLDHALGKLVQAPQGDELPLLHLITSASVKVDTSNCDVAAGGYVVNAASEPEHAGLWYRDPTTRQIVPVESPVRAKGVDGAIRLRDGTPRPPTWHQPDWPPKSFKEFPDVAGSPLWLYRIDVP